MYSTELSVSRVDYKMERQPSCCSSVILSKSMSETPARSRRCSCCCPPKSSGSGRRCTPRESSIGTKYKHKPQYVPAKPQEPDYPSTNLSGAARTKIYQLPTDKAFKTRWQHAAQSAGTEHIIRSWIKWVSIHILMVILTLFEFLLLFSVGFLWAAALARHIRVWIHLTEIKRHLKLFLKLIYIYFVPFLYTLIVVLIFSYNVVLK